MEMVFSTALYFVILNNFCAFWLLASLTYFSGNYNLVNIKFNILEQKMLTRKNSQYCTPKINTPSRKALSIHAQMINDVKLNEENMFNKLLRPPAKKQTQQNTISKKYDPKFKKPDIENLIQQNNLLKKEQVVDKKTILVQKVRINELEKKVSKLEVHDIEQAEIILEKNKHHHSAHTEILKKKIHDLQVKCMAYEVEIQKLNKLPNASLFQEQNIQKQHLLAQTIRLKAILVSFQQNYNNQSLATTIKNIGGSSLQNSRLDLDNVASMFGASNSVSNTNSSLNKLSKMNSVGNLNNVNNNINGKSFQQQFFRALKEENQKLQATTRLLENDKILLKAKQNKIRKQLNTIKKQLQMSKNKVISKQAEIQRLNIENKNLLFNKAEVFRQKKQEKQNLKIKQLVKNLQQLKNENKKLKQQYELMIEDNKHLKKKIKQKNNQVMDTQQQNDRLRLEYTELENKYDDLIKNYNTTSKILHRRGAMNTSMNNTTNFMFKENISTKKYLGTVEDNQKENQKKFNWGKPIKFQDIQLGLLTLWSLKNEGVIQSMEEILGTIFNGKHSAIAVSNANKNKRNAENMFIGTVKNQSNLTGNQQTKKNNSIYLSNYSQSQPYKNKSVTFQQFYLCLQKKPIELPKIQAKKLAKYIFCDHSQVQENQPAMQFSLIVTILKASISQLTYSLESNTVINTWKCILSKSKKFVRIIEEMKDPYIEQQEFFQTLFRAQSSSISQQQLNFMLINTFSRQHSLKNEKIILDRIKILQCIYGLQGNPQYMQKLQIGQSHILSKKAFSHMHQSHRNQKNQNTANKIQQNILKIKINDQDFEQSLIGDNTSSYIYPFGNAHEDEIDNMQDMVIKKTRSIMDIKQNSEVQSSMNIRINNCDEIAVNQCPSNKSNQVIKKGHSRKQRSSINVCVQPVMKRCESNKQRYTNSLSSNSSLNTVKPYSENGNNINKKQEQQQQIDENWNRFQYMGFQKQQQQQDNDILKQIMEQSQQQQRNEISTHTKNILNILDTTNIVPKRQTSNKKVSFIQSIMESNRSQQQQQYPHQQSQQQSQTHQQQPSQTHQQQPSQSHQQQPSQTPDAVFKLIDSNKDIKSEEQPQQEIMSQFREFLGDIIINNHNSRNKVLVNNNNNRRPSKYLEQYYHYKNMESQQEDIEPEEQLPEDADSYGNTSQSQPSDYQQ